MAVGASTRRTRLAPILVVLALVGLLPRPVAAFDQKEAEHTALKACEKQFCEVVLAKTTQDFSCRLQKTWAKTQLKENVEKKSLVWSVGDARCHSTLTLRGSEIRLALASPKWTVEFGPHVVHCDVEREKGIGTVDVTLSPKIVFRKGQAEKAWINVQKIDAPSGWKAGLWTVAKLEDSVGLFHRDILKEINRLIHDKCPAEYAAAANTKSQSSDGKTGGDASAAGAAK